DRSDAAQFTRVFPGLTPVTRPALETVAMAWLPMLHVKFVFGCAAPPNSRVHLNGAASPTLSVTPDGLIDMLTGTTVISALSGFVITLFDEACPAISGDAMTNVLPGEMPVTKPKLVAVAIEGSREVHPMVRDAPRERVFALSSTSIVAESCVVPPTGIVW